ncbi:MAG: helix-turn-helix domain-containing protein [Treponema sp.]|nr:helix-turn-helix domain-containing protein [Treponema sp.]
MTQTHDIKETLGNNIHQFRLKKNLTQEQLAEKTGITTITLSKLENGKSWISLETLEKIISVLEVKPYQLFIETQVEYRQYKEFILQSMNKILDESMENLEKKPLKIFRKKKDKK